MTALVVTLAVVVALLVVLVGGLLRSHAEILRTLHDAGLAHDPAAPRPRRPADHAAAVRSGAGLAAVRARVPRRATSVG